MTKLRDIRCTNPNPCPRKLSGPSGSTCDPHYLTFGQGQTPCGYGIKVSLDGKKVRLVDFPGQTFTLHYAGWDDQWIVLNDKGVSMLRCSGTEAEPYLINEGNKKEGE